MSIADNIKRLREKHGLTQSEFGDIAGVSDKAVWTWENGTAEPRMGAIQRIAEHFNVTKGSIVDDADDDTAVVRLSPVEETLLSRFHELNDEGQQVVLHTIDGLIASKQYIKTHSENSVVESA